MSVLGALAFAEVLCKCVHRIFDSATSFRLFERPYANSGVSVFLVSFLEQEEGRKECNLANAFVHEIKSKFKYLLSVPSPRLEHFFLHFLRLCFEEHTEDEKESVSSESFFDSRERRSEVTFCIYSEDL